MTEIEIDDAQDVESVVRWANKNLPEIDLTVLRYRYEDDAVALAVLDEIQSMVKHIELLTNYLEKVGQRAVTDERDLSAAADLQHKMNREFDQLKDEINALRAREQKWKALVEEVAKATGAFTEPTQTLFDDLAAPVATEAWNEDGVAVPRWIVKNAGDTWLSNAVASTATKTWQSVFDDLRKQSKAKLPRPPLTIKPRGARK